MVAHAETLIIDARTKVGVEHRFILDAFQNIEPGWKVIRNRSITEKDRDDVLKAATYYLYQGYLIHPLPIVGKQKSYCSELARKIFERTDINTEIPDAKVIMPAHFDVLSNSSDMWTDVSDQVKKFLEEVKSEEDKYRTLTKFMIDGIRRNRKRYEDRKKWRKKIKEMYKKNKITKSKYEEAMQYIETMEGKMEFKFWDT